MVWLLCCPVVVLLLSCCGCCVVSVVVWLLLSCHVVSLLIVVLLLICCWVVGLVGLLFVCHLGKQLIDSHTIGRRANSYTYIFLSVVDCLAKHCFYRENSMFLNLLIKKIGSATYHDLSRVITRDNCS